MLTTLQTDTSDVVKLHHKFSSHRRRTAISRDNELCTIVYAFHTFHHVPSQSRFPVSAFRIEYRNGEEDFIAAFLTRSRQDVSARAASSTCLRPTATSSGISCSVTPPGSSDEAEMDLNQDQTIGAIRLFGHATHELLAAQQVCTRRHQTLVAVAAAFGYTSPPAATA